MPDYSMCSNQLCSRRGDCARSEESGTLPDEHGQAWAHFTPGEDGVCRHRMLRGKPMTKAQIAKALADLFRDIAKADIANPKKRPPGKRTRRRNVP